ncbi:MAG: HEAT repeat domain-containing protein [Anaerolineae bacterium]|nr:HEAT repeat domain-containing protein [Anaerolineae bacterium]
MDPEDQLGDTIQDIVDREGAVPFSELYTLSDLSREKLESFVAAWQVLPVEERRRMAHALVELAEASFQVNFDAIFRHCLLDPDPVVRAACIDGLWENQEVTLVGPFLSALRADPSPDVRAAAAQALGRFVLAGELEEIEETIQARILAELLTTIHLAGESIEVRRRALESAAYAGTPEVLDAIDIAYDDEDERMQLSAIAAMGRSCDRRWRAPVLKELQSHLPAMRYEASLAAGEMALRPAVPFLARIVAEDEPQIRDAGIWALGQVGGPQARRVLLDIYADADHDTRAIVEEALAEHALQEGELDFILYQVDPDEDNEWLDDEDLEDPFDDEYDFDDDEYDSGDTPTDDHDDWDY